MRSSIVGFDLLQLDPSLDGVAVYRNLRLRALSQAPECFGTTYAIEAERPTEQWLERLSNKFGTTIVAKRAPSSSDAIPLDEDYAGIVTCIQNPDVPAHAYIFGMWVEPSVRGTGLASALLNEAVQWARNLRVGDEAVFTDVFLMMAEDNLRAKAFYLKNGFHIFGERFTGSGQSASTEVAEGYLT